MNMHNWQKSIVRYAFMNTKAGQQGASAERKRGRSGVPEPELRFDWSLIQTFLAVLEAGSLLGASRRLRMSQPTVGRHIEALEKQLGVDLFERTGRGLTPTGTATRLTEQARQMQQGADGLARHLQGADKSRAGLVRVSASRMIALHHLPSIVAAIQAEHEHVDIAVVASDGVTNLLRRDADIAIRMVQPQQGSLVVRRLGTIPVVPCASQHYLARWGTPKSARELLHHRLVGADRDESFRQAVAAFATAFDFDPAEIRLVYRSDDFAAQFEAVRTGLGVGFLSLAAVQKTPELVRLPVELPLPSLPVWLAVHREIRTNPRIRLVFNALADHLKKIT